MAGQLIRYQALDQDQATAAPVTQTIESLFAEPRVAYDMYVDVLRRDPLVFFVMMLLTLACLVWGVRTIRAAPRK